MELFWKISSSCDSRPKHFQLPLFRKAPIPSRSKEDTQVAPTQSRWRTSEPFIAVVVPVKIVGILLSPQANLDPFENRPENPKP